MPSRSSRDVIKACLPFLVPLVRAGRHALIDYREGSLRKACLSGNGGPDYPLSELSIHGDGDASDLARGLYTAFAFSMAEKSQLPEGVAQVRGMSGLAFRRFLNALVENLEMSRYLEIGSWHGSTAISALIGNDCEAVCIDNWSQFGGSVDVFRENLRSFGLTDRVRLIESDFRMVDYTSLGTFGLYLFDGPHREQDHYDGIVLAQPALKHDHVLLVDDWNWSSVRHGTLRALSSLGVEIRLAIELRTTDDDTHPRRVGPESDWHNGFFAAVVRKAG